MGFVVTIESPYRKLYQRVIHKLFHCPTFWSIGPRFQCPMCGKRYRCYWDGNDTDKGINLCNRCAND